jgi:6-phosphogluconate dehydrogenase
MNMQIGLIGLGKMGGNMAERLRRDGHQVIGYDRNPASARDVDSLEALAAALSTPRVVWVMVPSGEPTRATIASLAEVVESGDIIIDGGNSRYTDDQAHAAALAPKGIHYLDVGVSGGIWGITEGYALMVGGEAEAVAIAQPIFDSLKPAGDSGFVHAGPVGAGHFTKMVHNGIEYGLMQSYAEGFEIMHASEYELDLEAIAKAWMHGTVIRSWLLELAGLAFEQNGTDLADIKGWVADSGEGRWTVQDAIDHDVPAPIITLSLLARFSSRQDESYSAKVLAALRNQFGGHAVKSE